MANKIDIKGHKGRHKRLSSELKRNRPVSCKILIICEGEKTEPCYFKSFDMMTNSNGRVLEVKAEGTATNTIGVVEEAIRLKNEAEKNGRPYDSVWAVFDKDDFPPVHFDNAIEKAEAKGIGCAWSNQAFELWYIYHFEDRTTSMHRSEFKKKITELVRSKGHKLYTYAKNSRDTRAVLINKCGCTEDEAIERAERQAQQFTNGGRKFHRHNPCTMVYKLVRQLIGKDVDFNNMIEEKLKER